MSIRSAILEQLGELFEEEELPVPAMSDDMVLLESDLDSLGFAVLVTRLEDELGFDPFSLMDDPVYPSTLGEFISVYESCDPGGSA